MADNTKIEWTDATWNPVTGCSVVSPGCTNCYAMKLAGTRLKNEPSRKGLTKPGKSGPVWTGEVRFNEQWLDQPLRWKRPRRIFVCAHGDLFAENVPDAWIDRVFAVMALAPQHTFQVLTKRAERMREYVTANRNHVNAPPNRQWPLPNVWLGVSVEDQKRADERIPALLATPAAVRWISAEPLLGPVDLTALQIDGDYEMDALKPLSWRELWDGHYSPEATGCDLDEAIEAFREGGNPYPPTDDKPNRLDWVVVGGESGPGARPMHPDWARSIRDQCAEAGVAFHFKQWGNWLPVLDRDNDDPDWRSNYTDLRDEKRAIINLAGGMGFHGDRVHVVENVGKARAGRLIDGIEHNGFPEVRS
jgi:protein gp37